MECSGGWRALDKKMASVDPRYDGNNIKIGTEPYIGGTTFFKLFQDLINQLNLVGILRLGHAFIPGSEGIFNGRWKSSVDLGLQGTLALEWEGYTQNLSRSGLILNDRKDTLA